MPAEHPLTGDNDSFGRGAAVTPAGELDQDALWEAVLADHPELETEAEPEEPAGSGFDGAGPFLHLQAHVLVENQLFADQPLQARKAFHALREAGLSRHEAIHALARHVYELFLVPMGTNPVERERQYVDRLKQLRRRPDFGGATLEGRE